MLRIRDASITLGTVLLFPALLDAEAWRQTFQVPDCTECELGVLQMETEIDFRRVYTDVLQNWLQVDPRSILGETIEPFSVVKA